MTVVETLLNLDSLKENVPDLGGLVEYREGSPASRSVLSTKSGKVTVYALEKGQSLSEPMPPSHGVVRILEGEAEVAISGKTYKLQKGDGKALPAGKPHAVQAVTQCKMLLSQVRS